MGVASLGAPGVAAIPSPTLTITPDKSTYSVGEPIVLSILGDPMGGWLHDVAFGRLLFDADVAHYVDSDQTPLTSMAFGTTFTWITGFLFGGIQPDGDGFGDAFNQLLVGDLTFPVDAPLQATVVLEAIAPGTLAYEWEAATLFFVSTCGLPAPCGDFYPIAPGGRVTIVPEPDSLSLVALGLLALIARRRWRL